MHALFGWCYVRFIRSLPGGMLVGFPVLWVLFEWLQGIVLTGFAWMQPGYALLDTPLAAYAPLLGGHGVGVLMLVCIGLVLAAVRKRLGWKFTTVPLALIVLTGMVGAAMARNQGLSVVQRLQKLYLS